MDTTMKVVLPARIYVVPVIETDDEDDKMIWNQAVLATKEDLEGLGYRHRDDLNRAMRNCLNACAGTEHGTGSYVSGPYALLKVFIQSIIDYELIDHSDFDPDAEGSEILPAFRQFMNRGRNDD